jgi:hypothetical protein
LRSHDCAQCAADSGGPLALGDLRDRRAAAACRGLDAIPGLAGCDHARDSVIALGILGPATIEALGLGLGDALRLATPAIVVIFAGDSGEHVEQHRVDRVEHTRGEVVTVAGRHDPACRQVERDDSDALGGELVLEPLPVAGRETR